MLAYGCGLEAAQEAVTEYQVLGPTISGVHVLSCAHLLIIGFRYEPFCTLFMVNILVNFLLMSKKKDASTRSVDASVLRRSVRETSLGKQTSTPVHSRRSERIEKHTSPSPSPV
ncbi:hypothetical protein L1987_87059 [Smallanthus sonchifolius]|nr:hypothetical protein L1987_87059 [Smallanthus sonchifolius]